MFLGCYPGSQIKDNNLVNTLHEKNNQKFTVKKLLMLSIDKWRCI